MNSPGSSAWVDLYWLPLGAGDSSHCVRWNGRLFEALSARRAGRVGVDLYHSALEVSDGTSRFTIEMAPAWGKGDHRVVCSGPVGSRLLGWSRFFRYEVRRCEDGVIPDADEAVASPQRLSSDLLHARELLALLPSFPAMTWGRDELGTGDMWNSNSLVAWLLARSGHQMEGILPPTGGRAPGWAAGLAIATRSGLPITVG